MRHARSWTSTACCRPTRDAEVVDAAAPLQTSLGRLESRHPNPPVITFQTIGEHLDGVASEPKAWALQAVKAELRALRRVPAPTLETAFCAALAPLSHRLDSWYSALAMFRLDVLRGTLRAAAGRSHGYRTGIGLGAWATVERIPRVPLTVVPVSERLPAIRGRSTPCAATPATSTGRALHTRRRQPYFDRRTSPTAGRTRSASICLRGECVPRSSCSRECVKASQSAR